jgi:hypothetical protein
MAAENSHAATDMIKGILTDSDTLKIKKFSFGGIGFDCINTFPLLRSFLERKQIKVYYDSEKDGLAEYDYSTNAIYVGFWFWPGPEKKALVVHECVHAMYDLSGKKMSGAVSEAIAYIAQSQYIYANCGPKKRLTSRNSQMDMIFKYSWAIAACIQEDKKVEESDKKNLLSAISGHPYYCKNANSDAGFNGV